MDGSKALVWIATKLIGTVGFTLQQPRQVYSEKWVPFTMGRVSRFWLILARVQMNQSLATLNASTQSGYSKSREQRVG